MNILTTHVKSKNISIMYALTIFGGLFFFLPVLALYFEKSLFTATNVAIVYAVEAFANVIFEIPTGSISDLFGRRNTIIISNLIVLLALIFLFIGGSMTMFVLYAITNALARSLSSGTDSAIIYDTLKEEGRENSYKKIIGTYMALWPLGASLGAIIGGYIAKYSLQATVSASFIPIVIIFILSFFLKEPLYEKEQQKNILRHMFRTSKTVISNKQILLLLLASFVMLAFGEIVHLISPLFFKFKEIPIEYFGWIGAFGSAFSSLGHYLSHNISERFGNKLTLIIATLLSPIVTLLATISPGILVIIIWSISGLFFGIKNPIISHLINIEVDSGKRATIMSINSFMGQLGVAIMAPLIGYWADLYSIQTAVQLSSGFLLVVPIILIFIKDKKSK